ncbi:MAG: hypothetical protein KGR16_01120 [Verrucomicrobia bacterium]|nr:hypothetical protein [Verrucomicrobiota bacterium]MDE3047482.1 hypothetical protein [Verrucomicrobiota bacterium]
MKRLFLCLISIAVYANPCCCYDELEGEPDLFQRYAQVFSGSAEFLYWTIAEGALDYALKMHHGASGPTPTFAQGGFKHAKFEADPGFRLSLIYFRAPHYWDTRWVYTRMTNHGKDHADKPGSADEFLTGTFPHITTNPLNGAHSRIHFNYNVFDWITHRVFFPNPHLRLRFGGGASFAWMSQNWKVLYTDAEANVTTVRNRWSFTGAGLKTGTTVDWYWTGDLYLTALGYLGLLMGSYSNRAIEHSTFQTTGGDNPAIPVRNAHYEDARASFTFQLLFGPSYQKNFCSNRLEIFAGFEMNSWFNLQEVYRSTQAAASLAKETWMNTGLVTFYGLTTRATFDF